MRNENLIMDLGMHVGQDTAFYLAKGFEVLAVEASPLLAEEASQRFSQEIEDGRLRILNIGVGDAEGTFPFYVNAKYSEWSSFDKDAGTREGCKEILSIPMVPFEDLLNEYGVPYYLKIDVEGYDFTILKRLALVSDRPKYVSVENGWPFVLDFFVKIGYSEFKFINQAEVPNMSCPKPAREGKEVDWTFPFSASGPFGMDTPGRWKTSEEILKDINAYWNNPELDANIHGWYDLHAKFGEAE